jgi:hypothetical protein
MPRDLFVLLMMHPPSPDREFTCSVCGAALRGRNVVLQQQGRATCQDCTGRIAPVHAAEMPCACWKCQQARD